MPHRTIFSSALLSSAVACGLLFAFASTTRATLVTPGDSESGFDGSLLEFSTFAKWGSPTPGTPASVTYSFVTSNTVIYNETSIGGGFGVVTPVANFMPTGAVAAIEAAFDAWSSVANISFTEVADSGSQYGSFGDANIRIGGHAFNGVGGTLAHTAAITSSGSPLNTLLATWIDFDTAENWEINSLGNGSFTKDVFLVAAHEIGHAIGLDHEMTSSVVALMDPFYNEGLSGLQPDDIAGARFLYGMAAVPEASGFLFGGLVSGVIGLKAARRRKRATSARENENSR